MSRGRGVVVGLVLATGFGILNVIATFDPAFKQQKEERKRLTREKNELEAGEPIPDGTPPEPAPEKVKPADAALASGEVAEAEPEPNPSKLLASYWRAWEKRDREGGRLPVTEDVPLGAAEQTSESS